MSQSGKSYLANATHPSLGEGTVAGQVVAGEFALRFTSEAGTFDLLYDGMTIEFGSRKDPRVTFTSESDSDGTILTSNADITREYSLRRHAGTRAQIEDFEEQQEGKKRLWLTLGFCAGFVLLSALLGALVEWSLPRLINQVPVAWEKDLSKQVAADARKHFRPSGETNVATQLSSLVAQLAKGLPANEYEFRVTLVDVDEPNAFALPGGEIFVNEGLLRLCTNSVEGDRKSAETWLYDLARDAWTHLPAATLPVACGMNYNLEYDPVHRCLLLVTGPQTTVWALRLTGK